VDSHEVTRLLGTLRRLGGEPSGVEAKRAGGGLPQSIRQTLSAFSNTEGGVILLGVDEASGFKVVALDNPMTLRDSLVQMSRDDLTPPLRISCNVVEVNGLAVVVAEVPQVPPDLLPVYVTARGVTGGSYLRSGDGDRQLTQAEIALLMASRTQPCYDREPVPGTTIADLNQDSLRRTIIRIKENSPRIGVNDDQTILRRIGVISTSANDSPVTLAGLLAFGEFPQEWFPQLMVSIVVRPARSSDHGLGSPKTRFLDNVTARGSIPELIEVSLNVIRRNLAVRADISQRGARYDVIEFPLEAAREAIVNALLHRDYSPVSRGTQVQVDLFTDKLLVRNPGGLYGGVSIDDLGDSAISTSKNALLASLLSDTYLPHSADLVAENRASGLTEMLAATRKYGLPRPRFTSTIASFTAELDRGELLGPQVLAWMESLGAQLPTLGHKVAVAMLHRGRLRPAMLRQWGLTAAETEKILHDLVRDDIAIYDDASRRPHYVLAPQATAELEPQRAQVMPREQIGVGQFLARAGSASARELAAATGLSRTTVRNHLQALIDQGLVSQTGPSRSPNNRYCWLV
jgi:ATP-dependent DNA helicase RecG